MPCLLIGWILLAASTIFATPFARAESPDLTDPAIRGWIHSLKQPGTGVSCCSIADCRGTSYRIAADGYEVNLDGKWVRIPQNRILRGIANPMERGVLCRAPVSGAILCFVPGPEA